MKHIKLEKKEQDGGMLPLMSEIGNRDVKTTTVTNISLNVHQNNEGIEEVK